MRILLLVDCYHPQPKSSATLIGDLAGEFLRRGHEPIVATPGPGQGPRIRSTVEDGFRVLRIRTPDIKKASRIRRGVCEARLSRTFWKRGRGFFRSNPCDLVVYYSPTIFFGPLVERLKRLWGCPSYLILRDIFPQWAIDAGILREGLVARCFRHYERRQYRAADVIGVECPANVRYFDRPELAGRHKVEVLHNWARIHDARHPPRDRPRELPAEYADKVVFIYGGNIGVAQDMDNVLRLAENVAGEPAIQFLLVGDGSEAPRLRRAVRERGLANLAIRPPVDQATYRRMLDEADVGLITLDAKLKTFNYPSKMLGYMDAGLPILGSVNPGNSLKELIEDAAAGQVRINGDDEGLRRAALELAMDAQLRRSAGENARRLLAGRFSAAAAADTILAHVPDRT